jgi:hypothetical protein
LQFADVFKKHLKEGIEIALSGIINISQVTRQLEYMSNGRLELLKTEKAHSSNGRVQHFSPFVGVYKRKSENKKVFYEVTP